MRQTTVGRRGCFTRTRVPTPTGPVPRTSTRRIEADQLGHASNSATTCHTRSGDAAIRTLCSYRTRHCTTAGPRKKSARRATSGGEGSALVDLPAPRIAATEEAETVAGLLHDFNGEFDTPSPGPAVLAERLRTHLAGGSMAALLIGDPAVGVALLSFRPDVWDARPGAPLDELYVRPDRRHRGPRAAVVPAARGP